VAEDHARFPSPTTRRRALCRLLASYLCGMNRSSRELPLLQGPVDVRLLEALRQAVIRALDQRHHVFACKTPVQQQLFLLRLLEPITQIKIPVVL
jgi:hypothetical protein